MITRSNHYCNDYIFPGNGKVIITLGGGSNGESNHYFFQESNGFSITFPLLFPLLCPEQFWKFENLRLVVDKLLRLSKVV